MYNKEDYMRIDLTKYIPLDSRVFLKPTFREKIFKLIEEKLGKESVIDMFKISRQTFEFWKRGICAPKLTSILKMLTLADIDTEELKANFVGFKSRFNSGFISPTSLEVRLDEKLSEWIGLFEGDGYVSKKFIGLGNTCFDLVFFFLDILEKRFGLSKKQVHLEVRIPIKSNYSVAKPIEESLRLKKFKKIKISKKEKTTKPLIDARISVKVLAEILTSLLKEIENLIRNSPEGIKKAYISGFASAEGSINQYKNCRTLEIPQKDPNKLTFIKNLLSEVGITNIKGPCPVWKQNFRLIIRNRIDLEKFSNEIGFGHYNAQNQKLKEIMSNYSLSTKFRKRNDRYKEILIFLKSEGFVSAQKISEIENVSPKYGKQLLREMEKLELIKTDKSTEPYSYVIKNA